MTRYVLFYLPLGSCESSGVKFSKMRDTGVENITTRSSPQSSRTLYCTRSTSQHLCSARSSSKRCPNIIYCLLYYFLNRVN